MAAFEVFEHVKHIKQRDAAEKMWAVRIASHPHFDAQGQRNNFDAIKKLGEIGSAARRKSSYDFADSNETRLRMIGGDLRSRGDRWDEWVIENPKQMKWLKDAGKTLDDAREAFDVWFEGSLRDDDGDEVAGFGSVGDIQSGIQD